MIDERERTRDTNDIWLVVIDGAPSMFVWGSSEGEVLRKVDNPAGGRAVRTAWRHVPTLCGPGRMIELGATLVDDRFIDVAGLRFHLADRGRTNPSATKEQPMEPMEPDVEVVDEATTVGLVEAAGRPFEIVERVTLKRLRFVPRKPDAEDVEHASEGAHVVMRSKVGSGVVRLAQKARAPRVAPDASRMP